MSYSIFQHLKQSYFEKIKMFKKASKHYHCLLLIGLITLVASVTRKQAPVQEQPKTVVERNRFFSETHKNANYNITGVEKGRPLIYVLKETVNAEQILKEGLSVRFEGTPTPVNCPFTKLTDLCVVPEIPDELKLVIQCTNLPCEVQWVIYQPEPKQPTARQPALNLYFLEQSHTQKHLFGEITCNDPEVQTLDSDVTIYSDTPYTRTYHNNVIYVMFPQFTTGYIYVDVEQSSRICSFIDFNSPPVKIGKQQQIKDFIVKNSFSWFELEEVPKGDFSIECSAIRLDQYETLKSVLSITLKGWTDDRSEDIINQKIKSVARAQANDFTFIFKAPGEQYHRLTLQFHVDDAQSYLINLNLIISDTFVVDLGEAVHFNLKKDQKINLKLEADPDITAIEKYYFIQKRKGDIKLNNSECDPREGCQVVLEAIANSENMIYVSSINQDATRIVEEGKALFQFQEIEFLPLDKHFKHKIRLGDNIFFSKEIRKNKTYQVHVNSPNVLVYASGKGCQVPGPRCREKTSNYHHPFIYEAKEDGNLLLNVEGLENTEFEITVIEDNQLVELTDGTAFSYTMDQSETWIDFRFKLDQKKDVTFNLIAPLNALKLYVANSIDSQKGHENIQQSTDGYLQFKKQEIKSLQFTVSILKTKTNQKYFSHFTIIASTGQQQQRLDPTVTNYQTLPASKNKLFIFQFDKNDDYILAFSLFNMKDKTMKMQLKSSQDQKWDKIDPIIVKDIDFVDVRAFSQKLCQDEGSFSCQIFVRITNILTIPVDFSLTLLSRHAILELKDGIWQSFPSTYMITSSYFYFYPRHNSKNVMILYHSSLKTQLSYKLHRFDENKINPTEWPFPLIEPASAQSHHSVSIDKEQLNQLCWPNCVLLITIQASISDQGQPMSMYEYSFFKIMAENNQVELPQKQKVSLTLNQNEDKEVMIDLKYLLDKDQVTFYSSSTIGSCSITANLYSQKNQNCPIQNQESDLTISWGEYNLKTSTIKDLITSKGMESDKNVYLCTSIHSDNSCKMTLQYSSESDGFKRVELDSYEDIKVGVNEVKYYEVEANADQYSKIVRVSGFPFLALKKCQQPQQLKECKEQFKASTDKGKQIVVKTESFTQTACLGCMILLKVSSTQGSTLTFHPQMKNSSLYLKQKQTISDFLNQNESNRYQIHARKEEDLIINIHVQQGTVEVQVSDDSEVNLVKKSKEKERVVQFYLKGMKMGEDQRLKEKNTLGLKSPLALSKSFNLYHITISSDVPDKAASYSIGYASGKSEFYLQDGLIVDYQLDSKKTHTFSYCNPSSQSHVFYTLSSTDAQTLKELKINTYSMDSFDDEEKKPVVYTKPNIAKKTPNPTMMFDFPNASCFQIQLTNPSSKSSHVSMGINHQQVIFLPFGHEYPIYLHKGQYINILSDVNNPGFIDLTIKKCDESNPAFKYTFDYDGFIQNSFMFQTYVDETYSRYHVKANRTGTFYINIQGNLEENTMLTLQLAYSEDKTKKQIVQPGKHGELTYTFIDRSKATISFSPVQCDKCKNVKYHVYSSESQEDLYRQMVCPNAFFGVVTASASKPVHTEQIMVPNGQSQGQFVLNLQAGVSFVSVMAKLESGQQVYYKSVQIWTLWGKWSQQTSISQKIEIGVILLFFICCVAICVRRHARKGYRPLEQLPQ